MSDLTEKVRDLAERAVVGCMKLSELAASHDARLALKMTNAAKKAAEISEEDFGRLVILRAPRNGTEAPGCGPLSREDAKARMSSIKERLGTIHRSAQANLARAVELADADFEEFSSKEVRDLINQVSSHIEAAVDAVNLSQKTDRVVMVEMKPEEQGNRLDEGSP